MAKKNSKSARARRPQQRHLRSVPAGTDQPGTAQPGTAQDGPEDQALFQALRKALRSDEPLDLLAVVSGLLAVTDPRSQDPFNPGDQAAGLEELVESFIGTTYAETTAALTVLKAMVPDDATAERVGRELAVRRQPMPGWLTGLDRTRVDPRVWTMTHVLGDGDNYVVAATLPSGHYLSALVYVDHNLGTVVKDAFVIPEPLDHLIDTMQSAITDPDQTVSLVDPATARAVIEDAIDTGAHTYPPFQSDSWPMCRPIVEWLVRMLPAGGSAPARREWSDQEKSAMARGFFGSTFAAGLDRPDERDLLDNVLWFGTDYGPGDPLRWSPVNVEMLLADWFPRKIVADVEYLVRLPKLLRAFIRYAHQQRGIRAALTAETLDAVDHWEPQYQRLIRSDHPQGPAALLAGLFPNSRAVEGDDEDDEQGDDEYDDVPEMILASLARKVGGRDRLEALDAEPLPDEPFDWSGIADDIKPVVQDVLERCDGCADELLDVEHRTAMRRFLSRAAAGDPTGFRRTAAASRGAAAIAWVICRANDTAGTYSSALSVRDLLAWFGVKGSVSQRAEPLLRANGVDPRHLGGTMELGAADLLTSTRRQQLIADREWWLSQRAAQT